MNKEDKKSYQTDLIEFIFQVIMSIGIGFWVFHTIYSIFCDIFKI